MLIIHLSSRVSSRVSKIMSHITQSEIAKKLNVTRITVSKALRNHPDISKETKAKILKVAEELNYTPNLIAKNLITQKTNTIGVVIPDLENSFFAYAADSLIDASAEKNYNVFVTVSRENHQSEIKNIKNLLGMRVDGLLICVSQQTYDIRIFEHIKNINVPLVFFDRQIDGLGFPSVIFDDVNGALTALDQIIKNGFTKIAHFAGYSNVSVAKARKTGYTSALSNNGIELKNDWVIEGGFEVKDGYNSFLKLFNSQNIPEIIFTVNDRVALGAYKAAAECGLRIPDDIGIVGFGFNETAQSFSPSLAIINQDPRNLGNRATELLISLINGTETNREQNIIINEEFLWNDSIRRNK